MPYHSILRLRPEHDLGMAYRYAISQHPEVEARIVAELQSLDLAPTAERQLPRELTYADTCNLPYLQAVIKVGALPLSFSPFVRHFRPSTAKCGRAGGVSPQSALCQCTPQDVHFVAEQWVSLRPKATSGKHCYEGITGLPACCES